MLPDHYRCSSCGEQFSFAQREARYRLGGAPMPADGRIADEDLADILVRPGWCKDCAALCLVEDIEPLRAFEDAYAAVRAGGAVEYPLRTEFMKPAEALPMIEGWLRWRMTRRHPARALCCGRSNFELLDAPGLALKHEECDFGFLRAYYSIGSYCGSGPGFLSAANIRLHDSERQLTSLLTWFDADTRTWATTPAVWPPPADDD